MALLIGYSIAIAALIIAAAHLAEHYLLAFSRQTRFVWVGALALISLLTVATVFGSGPRLTAPSAKPARELLVSTRTTAVRLAPALSPVPRAIVSIPSRARHLDTTLIWCWLAATSTLLLCIVALTIRARRLISRSERGSMSGARVRVTRDVGPALVGVIDYEIIVPGWCFDLSRSDQALIIAHEREHARVFDPAIIFAAAVAIVLFPWNVALWYLIKRLRASIELDCDARVLRGNNDVHEYGLLLLKVGARSSLRPVFAAALGERTSELQRRIRAMSSAGQRKRPSVFSMTMVASVVLVGAAFRAPRPNPIVASIAESTRREVSAARGSYLQTARFTERSLASVAIKSTVGGRNVVQVLATRGALISKGKNATPVRSDTIYVLPPAYVTADLTDGDVHIVSMNGSPLDVSAIFRNSVESTGSMRFAHVILEKGGVGIKGELTDREKAFRVQQMTLADSVAAFARRAEPLAFDRRAVPGSSVISLIVDGNNRIVYHARLSVSDTTTNLGALMPRLFSKMDEEAQAPLRMMSLVDGKYGSRTVQAVTIFRERPSYAPLSR
jgi:beta-lactamase regulating signal transducer with metallopeptidase domain